MKYEMYVQFQEHGKPECDNAGRRTAAHDGHEPINEEERTEGYR